MAKNIFHPTDIIQDAEIAYIEAPAFMAGGGNMVYDINGEALPGNEQPSMPSLEEVHKEAAAILEKAKAEADDIVNRAKNEAGEILNNANEAARNMANQTEQDLNSQRTNFETERAAILEKAAHEAEEVKKQAEHEADDIRSKAYIEGEKLGQDAGYKKGYEEVERLINRLHVIINRTIDKRNDILDEVETQVVELALMMVRKVVKVIAENQKNVVVNNIIQALKKMKARSDVIIRVNLQDLEMASEHTESFIKEIEGDGKLSLVEDSSIEPGGCIVETDFGEIDARISSQLAEIENRIRDLMPISIRPGSSREEF
jgi:flagellar assembly protein FliH